MNIFTYRFPADDLSADGLTELKAAIAGRGLVLFQNMPASLESEFAGGTFTASTTDGTRGLYAFSMEDGVMDRTDWGVTAMDNTGTTSSQVVSVFGKWIIHIDVDAECEGRDFVGHWEWAGTDAPDHLVGFVGTVDKPDFTDANFTNMLTTANKVNQNEDTGEASETISAVAMLKSSYTVDAEFLHPVFGRNNADGDHRAVDFDVTI